ncbi:MAG: sodium:proton antiporter [Spirochaetales bacterium]|nr:sodium:proton antiporter [Spirochaetales bacterium]
MNRTGILQVVSRKLAPFVVLFGFYLVSYGHLTPGGGFQGGVVIAAGVILLLLGQPPERLEGLVNVRLFGLVETVSLLLFLGAGIIGIILGGAFLQVLLPTGSAGRITDAGFIFILNVVIGMKVGAGITVICYRLFMES